MTCVKITANRQGKIVLMRRVTGGGGGSKKNHDVKDNKCSNETEDILMSM